MHLVTFERRSEGTTVGGTPRLQATSMGDAALGFESLDEVPHGARRLGALLDVGPQAGAVVDLNRALAIKLALDDAGAPEAEADSMLPPDMRLFLESLPSSLDSACVALAFTLDALDRYDAPDVLRAGVVEPAERVQLCAPVCRPGKLIAVDSLGQEPRFELMAPSSIADPGSDVVIPAGCDRVGFAGGLAVVIGSSMRDVSAKDALSRVAGYTCVNDLRARGLDGIGHSCDGFTPLGPTLVTADEIPDPSSLAVRTALSGEALQSSSIKEMPWPVAEIVARVSRGTTLEPGDVVIAVVPRPDPPRWLRDGDLLEVEVERIGRLRSYVREEASGT